MLLTTGIDLKQAGVTTSICWSAERAERAGVVLYQPCASDEQTGTQPGPSEQVGRDKEGIL